MAARTMFVPPRRMKAHPESDSGTLPAKAQESWEAASDHLVPRDTRTLRKSISSFQTVWERRTKMVVSLADAVKRPERAPATGAVSSHSAAIRFIREAASGDVRACCTLAT